MRIYEESLNRLLKIHGYIMRQMILIMQVRLSVSQLKECMIGFYIMK